MKKTNFSSQPDFNYQPEHDLVALASANNYHHWIISFFSKYLKQKKVLEVGAGIGSFAKCLLDSGIVSAERLYLIEPSKNLHQKLRATLVKFKLKPDHFYSGFLGENLEALKNHRFDCVIYNNVFEHIKNDQVEIRNLFKLLNKNGRVLSFTPAVPFLYSKFDQALGHYRRYDLNQLTEKFKSAGFEIEECQYLDFWGAFIWLIQFKLLGATEINPGLMQIYDKFLLPIFSKLDIAKSLNFGKNILVIAKKTQVN